MHWNCTENTAKYTLPVESLCVKTEMKSQITSMARAYGFSLGITKKVLRHKILGNTMLMTFCLVNYNHMIKYKSHSVGSTACVTDFCGFIFYACLMKTYSSHHSGFCLSILKRLNSRWIPPFEIHSGDNFKPVFHLLLIQQF